MNAIIQNFQEELSPEERKLFEANARLAGRRPGMHLKAIIFGEKSVLHPPLKRRKEKEESK
jgi:hypothetical protein